MRVRFALVIVPLLGLFLGCGTKPTESTLASPGTPPNSAPVGASDAEVRATAAKRLKSIGLAFYNYESAHVQFPSGIACKPSKENPTGLGLSWRVLLLPYLEQDNLFRQFKLDEPWDSEHNKALVPKMPEVFASPGKEAPFGLTYLRAIRGPRAFLFVQSLDGRHPGHPLRGRKIPGEFPDGTENTLAVAEAAEPVIWTKPDDLDYDGKELPKLGGVFPNGFYGLLADSQVLFFPKEQTSDDLLRSLLTIDGKEVVDLGAIRKANGVKEMPPTPPRGTGPTERAPTPPPYTGPKK